MESTSHIYCPKCGRKTLHKLVEIGDSWAMVCDTCTRRQPIKSFKENGAEIMPRKSSKSDSTSASTAMTLSSSSTKEGGLTLPQFDIAGMMPSDLFSKSSSVPEMEAKEADEIEAAILRQRNSMRVASANLDLANDVASAAIKYKNLEGKVIDYQIASQNNQTKLVNLDIAGLNTQIAESKREMTDARLEQQQILTQGTEAKTPLFQQRVDAEFQLMSSQIQQVQLAAQKGSEALAESRRLAGI